MDHSKRLGSAGAYSNLSAGTAFSKVDIRPVSEDEPSLDTSSNNGYMSLSGLGAVNEGVRSNQQIKSEMHLVPDIRKRN